MKVKEVVAAVSTALFCAQPATAQDVALIAREGGIVLTGSLQGYDGEFYRIETSYGLLTVDGQGVICKGPACPDLLAPRAEITIVGAQDAERMLIPGLFQAFAEQRGLIFEVMGGEGFAAVILEPDSREELASISFRAMTPATASAALESGVADLKLGFRREAGFAAHSVALDALAVIVAPDNPTPEISTADLSRVLTGEVTNWAEIGGPDMPLVLHALRPGTDLQQALADRLGAPVAAQVLHGEQQSLAEGVARDPWAIAVTGRSGVQPARGLTLTDSCGFPLLPTPLAVKAEDYPLAIPLMFMAAKRRLPLMTREFLDFLRTPQAQKVIAAAGYVDRSALRQPMTSDGLRLINAIQGAGEDVTLADLKGLVALMDGADRLSLTFRFEDGSSTLDAHSRDNLVDLAQLIASGQFRGEKLLLAGFSDGSGDAEANRALSVERANRVAQELAIIAPDLSPEVLPKVEGFGEALPMACDETPAGRQLNRRVELWVLPDFPERPEAVDPQP
jgi:phosphate transport system substrate-binding protein